MIQKLKLSNRHARQALSGFVSLLMIASVSYLGVRLYNSSHAATPGAVYITPATVSTTTNSTVSVTVREDSGTAPVTSVQFFLNYNSSQLQYVSKVETGEFDFEGRTDTSTAGLIMIHRGMQGSSLTGDHGIVTLNFKVLATSGSSAITLDSNKTNTIVYSGGQNIMQTVSGATITVPAVSPPPPPPPPTGVTKNAVFTVTPAGGSYTKDSTISVAVQLNSPTQGVYSTEPILIYPANQLQYVSTTNSAAFPLASRTANTNGQLDLIRGIAMGGAGFTGNGTVATVNFKVIGTSGSIPLSFKNTSAAYDSNGQNLLASSTGGSYSITQPGSNPTPPPPPPTTTPGPTPTPPTPPASNPGSPSTKPPVYKPTVTYTPQSGGSAALNGNSTELQGSVELAPVVDPTILADNPGDTIVKVEYLIGKKLVSTKTSAPFTFNLDTKDYKNGTYVMTIKTYYSSGTVDTSTDKLIVKNPVTLSYIFKHYLGTIILLLLILLAVAFAIWKFIWPRYFGGNSGTGAGDGYEGYDGYVGYGATDDTNNSAAMPEAPEPAVITPTAAPTADQSVTTFRPEEFQASDQPAVIAPTAPVAPTAPAAPTAAPTGTPQISGASGPIQSPTAAPEVDASGRRQF